MFSAPILRFRQGDHICVFYEDETALLEFLVSYFLEGLKRREVCFAAQPSERTRRLRQALTDRARAMGVAIPKGALSFHTTQEVYFSTPQFAPVALMGLLQDSIAKAKQDGFTGIRMAGDMEFAAQKLCECDQLMEYENLVAATFPGRPVIGVCQYRVAAFEKGVLDVVLTAHQQALTQRIDASSHSSFAIRKGRFTLDIIAGRVPPESQFYYVAQEHGKHDILGWGVQNSFDAAMQEGEDLLTSLGAD